MQFKFWQSKRTQPSPHRKRKADDFLASLATILYVEGSISLSLSIYIERTLSGTQ